MIFIMVDSCNRCGFNLEDGLKEDPIFAYTLMYCYPEDHNSYVMSDDREVVFAKISPDMKNVNEIEWFNEINIDDKIKVEDLYKKRFKILN